MPYRKYIEHEKSWPHLQRGRSLQNPAADKAFRRVTSGDYFVGRCWPVIATIRFLGRSLLSHSRVTRKHSYAAGHNTIYLFSLAVRASPREIFHCPETERPSAQIMDCDNCSFTDEPSHRVRSNLSSKLERSPLIVRNFHHGDHF